MSDGKFSDQVYGIALVSPLGSALANLFMDSNEQKLLESDLRRLVSFYGRYVDNIFRLFENEHQPLTFLNISNIQYSNLNFNIEKEHTKQLPFLDVVNTFSDRSINSVYRKSTFTRLLQNYKSFVLFIYKKEVPLKL